jgi:hypothetical protein
MAAFGVSETEPRYMKRKVKAGKIEADFESFALLVHYEVEATVLGDRGEAMQVEKKSHVKRVRLKALGENTNVPLLAEEIVQQCKLIHHSKLPLVQELVHKLREYSLKDANSVKRHGRREERKKKKHSKRSCREQESFTSESASTEITGSSTATLENIDEYMEKLYDEDMKEKVNGTAMILELAKNAGNLEILIQNESLMGALSRVLKEDYKQSRDLVVNLMYIFFSFSNFSQLHGALTNYRVGNETMRVIDLELKRHNIRLKELQTMTRICSLQDRCEQVPSELWSALHRLGDYKKARKKVTLSSEERGVYDATTVAESANLSSIGTHHKSLDLQKERNKVRQFIKKQDKLLFICFHVLMNIAEDVQIERKIVKRKCIEYLASVLERTNAELLILAVGFLKKLSIFEENKNQMVEQAIVPKLVKFIPCNNKGLMQVVCKLLLNLSFDHALREEMVKSSLIPKLVELLKHAPFRQISLKILYHLSMDDRCKSMFTYTDCIPIVMQLLVNFPNSKIPIELIALTINLSHNARNAEMLCNGNGLKELFERVIRCR